MVISLWNFDQVFIWDFGMSLDVCRRDSQFIQQKKILHFTYEREKSKQFCVILGGWMGEGSIP
jgi:hypothetical protein